MILRAQTHNKIEIGEYICIKIVERNYLQLCELLLLKLEKMSLVELKPLQLSNEYFDVRHNDYLNAAKEKREPLNDSQFIEYLYNRAYSILYLLRLKS